MAGDGVDDLLGIAALLELLERVARMARVEVGIALVVEVVDEPGDRVELLVLAEALRVGAHRRLDAERVLAQGLGLGPLAEKLPGLVSWGPCPGRPESRGGRVLPSRAIPMQKFVIEGGIPLSGEIVAAGNKNAALPIIAACLLTEEELVLSNVPRIRDTETQVALLEGMGVKASWTGPNEVRLQARFGERRDGRGRREQDPRLVPRRRPPARALRRGADAAAGRRHDRPPPPRPAPRRIPRHGREGLAATAGSSCRRRPTA